ncbi:uncharacterized protein LOC120072259 [Benincasa hispida]|uniref:uncharacterized protein LOC120072259 n=1 Tax=Benincasa hispida TaxID=102211 RepID=UPI0019000162|nr:uncharacterized protein LOC120072259 [Benincasa hispida]
MSTISTLFTEDKKTERRRKLKGMAKKMVHVNGGGGIGKRRLIKRSKKKSLHKVIDYMLSDCYLFAPLLSSPSPINSHAVPTRGIEIRERTKDNRSLAKTIQDYLKSDCYMYASLLAPQSLRLKLREKGETGHVGYVKKVRKEVMVMTDFVEATVNGTPTESSKRSIYATSPSISISGERDPKTRRIVVD